MILINDIIISQIHFGLNLSEYCTLYDFLINVLVFMKNVAKSSAIFRLSSTVHLQVDEPFPLLKNNIS